MLLPPVFTVGNTMRVAYSGGRPNLGEAVYQQFPKKVEDAQGGASYSTTVYRNGADAIPRHEAHFLGIVVGYASANKIDVQVSGLCMNVLNTGAETMLPHTAANYRLDGGIMEVVSANGSSKAAVKFLDRVERRRLGKAVILSGPTTPLELPTSAGVPPPATP